MTKEEIKLPEIIPNLHPLFVHFPIALVSLSALFHVAAAALRGKPCATHCAILAHTTLWLGALAALPTVFFGWQAFNSVSHDEASHAAMLVHRAWALVALTVLLVLAVWDIWRNKVDTKPALWFVALVIGAWGLVATTAWHGGELVYRHGLGVMSLPEPESEHGHAHSPSEAEVMGASAHDHEHTDSDHQH